MVILRSCTYRLREDKSKQLLNDSIIPIHFQEYQELFSAVLGEMLKWYLYCIALFSSLQSFQQFLAVHLVVQVLVLKSPHQLIPEVKVLELET